MQEFQNRIAARIDQQAFSEMQRPTTAKVAAHERGKRYGQCSPPLLRRRMEEVPESCFADTFMPPQQAPRRTEENWLNAGVGKCPDSGVESLTNLLHNNGFNGVQLESLCEVLQSADPSDEAKIKALHRYVEQNFYDAQDLRLLAARVPELYPIPCVGPLAERVPATRLAKLDSTTAYTIQDDAAMTNLTKMLTLTMDRILHCTNPGSNALSSLQALNTLINGPATSEVDLNNAWQPLMMPGSCADSSRSIPCTSFWERSVPGMESQLKTDNTRSDLGNISRANSNIHAPFSKAGNYASEMWPPRGAQRGDCHAQNFQAPLPLGLVHPSMPISRPPPPPPPPMPPRTKLAAVPANFTPSAVFPSLLQSSFPRTPPPTKLALPGVFSMRRVQSLSTDVQTLIIKKIPARITPTNLLELWPAQGSYNLLYLPYNHRTRRTAGFVIVNFISNDAAAAFRLKWQGQYLLHESSAKKLDICVAEVQGLIDNLIAMKKNKKINRMKNVRYLPVIIQPDGTPADFKKLMEDIQLPPDQSQRDTDDASMSSDGASDEFEEVPNRFSV